MSPRNILLKHNRHSGLDRIISMTNGSLEYKLEKPSVRQSFVQLEYVRSDKQNPKASTMSEAKDQESQWCAEKPSCIKWKSLYNEVVQ